MYDRLQIIVGQWAHVIWSTEISVKLGSSVTRFDEIKPLRQKIESPWTIFVDGLFSICQTFVPTLSFLCY